MTDLFVSPCTDFPDSAVESIYKLYARLDSKAAALKSIRNALARICDGEIDGSPRTAGEAIEYLRERSAASKQQFAGRTKKFIPMPSTYFNQRRYLPKPDSAAALPLRWQEASVVLEKYPTFDSASLKGDVKALASILNVIVNEIECIEQDGLGALGAIEYLILKTEQYAFAVSSWPKDDLKFIPNPRRFYGEKIYEQNPEFWNRSPRQAGFVAEREQVSRIIN